MAKVDQFLVFSVQTGHHFYALTAVPQLDVILMEPHVHFQVDVLAADGIRVAFNAHDTIALDTNAIASECDRK